MTLQETIDQVTRNKHLFSLDEHSWCGYTNADGHYYQYFPIYALIHGVKNFLELGTREGRLARLMSEVTKVTAADIDLSQFWYKDLLQNGTITPMQLVGPKACLDIDFKQYDMIFIDIEHEGSVEIMLHNKLIELGYNGLVFWDDVEWDSMKQFWQSIEQEKLVLNWNVKGIGVVKYE